jgi:fumarate hydratase class II
VAALNPRIGYKTAAQISLLAYREDLSLKDAVLKLGSLTAEQFDKWVRPRHDPSSGVIVAAGRKIAFVFQT